MAAYSYSPTSSVTLYVQNTGTGSIDLVTTDGAAYYFDGGSITPSAGSCLSANNLAPGSTCSITITQSESAESSHTIKVITADGGIFNFNVVAGQTG